LKLAIVNHKLSNISGPNQQPNKDKGNTNKKVCKTLSDTPGSAYFYASIQNQQPNKVKNRTDQYS